MIKDSHKQSRHDDDLNQPLSVQPWGRDGDKRRYWLIEGQDDTHFRLYRESNPALKTVTWRSMAGDIDELVKVAGDLKEEGSNAAVRLHDRIMAAKARFEASEDVSFQWPFVASASRADLFKRSEDVATIVWPDERSSLAQSQAFRSMKVVRGVNGLAIHSRMTRETQMLFQLDDQPDSRAYRRPLSQLDPRLLRVVDKSSQDMGAPTGSRCSVGRPMSPNRPT